MTATSYMCHSSAGRLSQLKVTVPEPGLLTAKNAPEGDAATEVMGASFLYTCSRRMSTMFK
jgi:hypothetical protein